jgi:YVTN family beta-propeller protein
MNRWSSKVLGAGCLLLVALFLFYALSVLPLPVRAQTVTATIPVGTAPIGVAVTPNGAYAYVTNNEGNTVSVINTATNTVTATITGFNYPLGVAVTPDGAYAYVANSGGNSVSVISTATNTVTATISTYFGPNIFGGASAPHDVAITPNGAYAYATNVASGTVSVISTATNTITANITVGGEPNGVAITPDGAYAYVANLDSNTVSVISTSNAITSPTPTPTASPTASPSPSPSAPELSWLAILPLLLSVFSAAVLFRQRKATNLKQMGKNATGKKVKSALIRRK